MKILPFSISITAEEESCHLSKIQEYEFYNLIIDEICNIKQLKYDKY